MRIDKNVKLAKRSSVDCPFGEMEIGDSCLIECGKEDVFQTRNRINSSCSNFKAKNDGFNFTIRKVEGGLRIWRIEKK